MSATDLLADSSVVLCCGTGGVGKTTTAAAVALSEARNGRRVVVVTIDPARRLADALDLDGIDDDCVYIPLSDNDGDGELWVTMLDTKATFDRLIEHHGTSTEQVERILANRYYRNLSTSLSGTREFMALERLYELHNDDRFDLVVVDTPPSRNALEFLDAPDRLGRFLDGRLFRIAAPTGRLTKRLTAPLILLLRRVARVVSPEVVDDTLAFLEAFAGMEDGFRARARAMGVLLASESTSFVLVTAATAEAVEESCFFAERLHGSEMEVAAIVVNRLQPRFTDATAAELDDELGRGPQPSQRLETLRDLTALSEAQERELDPLLETCPEALTVRVEQLGHDLHDLDGISQMSDRLTAQLAVEGP
ncbi:MAG: ArsA family ATPase [Acidimicrobiales bacterium]